MKKTLLSVLVAATFALPLAASATTTDELRAQIQALLAQVQTLREQIAAQAASTSPNEHPGVVRRERICSMFAAHLAEGSAGNDVTSLQDFLSQQGFLSASSTGFFGPITARALAQFQLHHGIITREGDGGEFGSRTWQFILGRWCGTTPMPPITGGEGAGSGNGETGGGVTSFGETESSDGITISSFTGPASLDVEQSGTWTISAVSASAAALEYHITWGDEALANALDALSELANPTFVTTTTFSHAYARAGNYPIILIIRDADGHKARTRTTVHVARPAGAGEMGLYPWLTDPKPDQTSAGTSGEQPGSVACPMDAKLCPDGTVLSRSGASCTFPVCPLSQAAQQMIGGAMMPGAGAPREGEIHCTYGDKAYSELQTYSVPVSCVEGTSGSICGTKVFYCHFGQWFQKTN